MIRAIINKKSYENIYKLALYKKALRQAIDELTISELKKKKKLVDALEELEKCINIEI